MKISHQLQWKVGWSKRFTTEARIPNPAENVERENSSVESILSFGGVWQVYHELQELEEEDKGREEVQEIERESQVEEKHSHEDDHVDEVQGLKHLEPQCVCRCCDTVQQTRLCALRSCGCQWKWSVVYASCSATQL